MKISNTGLDLIKKWEGFSANAYYDTIGRVWTIGYGWTNGVKKGDTITKAEASKLLEDSVNNNYAKGITSNITVTLNQNQFDALCSFVYNLGRYVLPGTTLLKHINAKEWDKAANKILEYSNSNGQRVQGLFNRRKAEVELFLKVCEDKNASNSQNSSQDSPSTTKTYKVIKSINGYLTSSDAKSKKNKKAIVKVGTYHIFNEKDGMINVSSKKGIAGSWINPGENIATTSNSSIIKIGDKVAVAANKLYATSSSTTTVKAAKMTLYVESINTKWKNSYRLVRNKNKKDFVGFARKADLTKK